LTKAPDGSYRITPYDLEFEKQLKIGKKFMAQKAKRGVLVSQCVIKTSREGGP
jgi:hypothetical protein